MNNRTSPLILVIDDESAIRLGVASAIRRHGYETVVAENGEKGLEAAKCHTPDLIISDVMMPPPNGFELKRIIASDPALANIPFIFLTARSGLNDRISAFEDGADDFVPKPFAIQELLARVDALLRRVKESYNRGSEDSKKIAQQNLERLQNEILRNFQHEFRTPITNIMLPLQLALRNKFDNPSEQSQFIEAALSNVDRLNSLVSDIMTLSNIDHGTQNTVRQTIDTQTHIITPIKNKLARYSNKQLAFSHCLNIQGEIKMPRHEFTQAIVHLADNAFKFSPEHGKVTLAVSTDPAGATTITIFNEGDGIPEEEQEKVFERFYQISHGDSRKHEGLGVGLTIARAVFQQLGGYVTFQKTHTGFVVEAFAPGIQPGDIVYG